MADGSYIGVKFTISVTTTFEHMIDVNKKNVNIDQNGQLPLLVSQFTSVVLCHNPPLPGLPNHAFRVLDDNRTDHNTNKWSTGA